MLSQKDPEYFEKVGNMTDEQLLALGEEFCKHTVDKLQHGG